MKTNFVILLLLMNISTYSQTFNGIEVGKSYTSTALLLKQKGFIKTKELTKYINEFSGQLPSGENVTISVVQTKKTGIVWKLRIAFVSLSNWSTLKSQYEKYKNIVEGKYGKAKEDFAFFSNPYFEGDGYEIQALGKEKANFMSFFNDDKGNNITVELGGDGTYGQVIISYENLLAVEIKTREEKEIENSVF